LQLKEGLKTYLKNIDNIETFHDTSAKDLIKNIRKDRREVRTKFFTFNYTNSIEELLDSEGAAIDDFEVVHIHGTIDKNIIFGTEDLPAGQKYEHYVFVQKSSGSYSPEYSIIHDIESADIVTFFGHSLGESDKDYFRNLFGKYSHYSYMPKLIEIRVYFHNGEEGLERLEGRINTLTDGNLRVIKSKSDYQPIPIA